jgi:hypothetical protein
VNTQRDMSRLPPKIDWMVWDVSFDDFEQCTGLTVGENKLRPWGCKLAVGSVSDDRRRGATISQIRSVLPSFVSGRLN